MKAMVLVLDDEAHIRNDLLKHIRKSGYEVCDAETLEEANRIIQAETIDIAIIDLKIDYSSDYGGIAAIDNINKWKPKTKVIVLSAYELTEEVLKELESVKYDSFVPKGGSENYLTRVIEELKILKSLPEKNFCFVIMPFSDTKSCSSEQWTDIFETMIKPAVEQPTHNYDCYRACLNMGNIIKDILENLNRADLVVADLTDRNSNVFYELGVRHALRDKTILVTQNLEHVPFDLQHYACVVYDNKTINGRDKFKSTIGQVLKDINENPTGTNFVSPVREYLNLTNVG